MCGAPSMPKTEPKPIEPAPPPPDPPEETAETPELEYESSSSEYKRTKKKGTKSLQIPLNIGDAGSSSLNIPN